MLQNLFFESAPINSMPTSERIFSIIWPLYWDGTCIQEFYFYLILGFTKLCLLNRNRDYPLRPL